MYLVYSLFAFLFLGPCLADQSPFFNDAKFDDGEYGEYVLQTFRSNPDIETPVWNVNRPFTDCDDGSFLFIAPRGNIANSTPIILDASGSPVWAATREYGEVYNLQVQQYKGESFLTFWAGDDAVGGHGAGHYHMLDKHYNERFKISAAHGLDADLHAFQLTADDTALSSIYEKRELPLASVLPDRDQDRGWIWDSVFQELDFETGEVLFEWRASEHFDLGESFAEPNDATEDDPWDAWHINSVQKDAAGNYLVSLRYTRSAVYIDGRDGAVLWRLGGARNSFWDLSDGEATTFVGQHDAQLISGGGGGGGDGTGRLVTVTLFDNRADWFYTLDERSRGKRVELDTERMTARLDAAFAHPGPDILSVSQGSYQTLPNGHVLIGYGYNGAVTEFSAAGEPLCDVRFEPASAFGSGNVQSYRNLKFNWTGLPDTDPDLVLDGQTLYVSWNGATEVRNWVFQDVAVYDPLLESSEPAALAAFEDVLSIGKVGFETEVPILETMAFRRFVRVVGIDGEGNRLGKSKVIDIGALALHAEDEIADSITEEEAGQALAQDGGVEDAETVVEDEAVALNGEDDDPYEPYHVDDLESFIILVLMALVISLLACLLFVSRQMPLPARQLCEHTNCKTRKLDSLARRFAWVSGMCRKGKSDIAAEAPLMAEFDVAELEKGAVENSSCDFP